MRIGIDARAYHWAGLGRYTKNLLRHLTAQNREHEFVVFAPRTAARDLAELPRARVVPVTDSYYSLREQTVFLGSLLRERLDVMHFLHFNAPVLYRRPTIVTVHDLTRFFFPAQKQKGLLHQWMYEEVFRAAVQHARRVIAVSEHTRRDLQRFFPDVADRTAVIHEGVEHERYHPAEQPGEKEILARYGITRPYLLFVGVWMNHKNLPRLLKAFHFVRQRGFGGMLVIAGAGRTYDEDVPGIVRRLQLSAAVILPGLVPEDALPALYRHAVAYVFPSLYEGFGLTPLEAMACGTPVVASAVASMPEILGSSAEFVNSFSVEDIARGILRVVTDDERRRALAQEGQAWAQRYRWERCASETLKVYRAVGAEVRAATVPQAARLPAR